MCPSSGKITVNTWYLSLCMDDCIPDSHPHSVTNNTCRLDTFISPDDGHIVARNMSRKEINILRKIVHQVGFIYKMMMVCDPGAGHQNNVLLRKGTFYFPQ